MVTIVRPSFYSQTYSNLCALGQENGLTEHMVSILYNWHYKKNQRDACKHQDISFKAKAFLEGFDNQMPEIKSVKQSLDGTVKFLVEMKDGQRVETVLIPFTGKYSVCVSSQVGCAVKCSFCFTGTQGFKRNLKTEEIIGQFLVAQTWLTENRPAAGKILNVVYMGQGEPLHNFEAVRDSASIFISQHGISLAPRKVTVSTSGHAPGLRRWLEEMPDVNIALSLHSPFNEKRSELIPINQRFALEEILPLVDAIPKSKRRFATYEYVMIQDFNDGDIDAHATGALLKGKKAYINLIPFNGFPDSQYRRSSLERIQKFKAILDSYEIPTLIRITKGEDILGACGQLKV